MNQRTCRTCGETLKQGYYHKHATALQVVLARIEAEREAVCAAYRAARRETEVA